MMTDNEWVLSQRKLDRLEERYLRERDARRARYNIPCKGEWSGTSLCCSEPPEFSCGYENGPDDCSTCVCNGGSLSPITGRRVYQRRPKDEQQKV